MAATETEEDASCIGGADVDNPRVFVWGMVFDASETTTSTSSHSQKSASNKVCLN